MYNSTIYDEETDELVENGHYTFIPESNVIQENGYLTLNQIVELLRKYKNQPESIQFLADMLEE